MHDPLTRIDPLAPPSHTPAEELADTLREYRAATKPIDRFRALERAAKAYVLVHPDCAKGKGRPQKGATPPATRWLAEELGLKARTISDDIALVRRLAPEAVTYLRLSLVASRGVIRSIAAIKPKSSQADFARFAELHKNNTNAGKALKAWTVTKAPPTRQALLMGELAKRGHYVEARGADLVVVDGLQRYVAVLLGENTLPRRRRTMMLSEHHVKWTVFEWSDDESEHENLSRCCREIKPMPHALDPRERAT